MAVKSKNKSLLRYDVNLIIKGFLYGSISIVIAKILNYFWRIYVARLGTEAYGAVSVSMAFFNFLIVFASFGLLKASGRFISESYAKRNFKELADFYATLSFFVFIISSIISFLIFVFREEIALYFFKNVMLSKYVGIIALAIPVILVGKILGSYIVRVNKAVGFFNFAVYVWTSVWRIVLLFYFLSHYCDKGFYAFLSYVLAELSYFFIIWIYFTKNSLKYLRRAVIRMSLFKKVFLFSLPLTFSFMIGRVYAYIDTFLINYFKGLSVTGVYNAAVPLAQLLTLSLTAVSPLFVTIISERFYKNDREGVAKLMDAVNRYLFALNSFVWGVFLLYGKEVLVLLFGKEYVDAYLPLLLLSLNYIFLVKGGLFSRLVINTAESVGYVTYLTFTSITSNVLLNLLLIPSFGMVGAALATLIVGVPSSFVHYWKAKQLVKDLSFMTWKHVAAVMFSLIILYGLNKVLHIFIPYFDVLTALVFLFVAFVVYVAILLKFKVVRYEELVYILSLFKKKISL